MTSFLEDMAQETYCGFDTDELRDFLAYIRSHNWNLAEAKERIALRPEEQVAITKDEIDACDERRRQLVNKLDFWKGQIK